MNDSIEPRLKIVEGTRALINNRPEVGSADRGIGQPPVRTFEEIPVVHHLSDKSHASRMRGRAGQPFLKSGSKENRLAGIGIGGPFIENQRSAKVGEIFDFVEQRVGKKVVNDAAAGIAWKSRSEMPPGFDGQPARTELNADVGILF